MFKDNAEEARTTIFPVVMYKVSKEWIDNLFNEIKRTVMTRAIECDCSKEFLADLNELELQFSNDANICVQFPTNHSLARATRIAPAAAEASDEAPEVAAAVEPEIKP